MKRTLSILGLLAGACLVLALGLDLIRTAWGAPSIANAMLYSLVGPVNTAGTQVNPATEDTLSAVSTALGGGEDVQTAIKAMTDQSLPANADVVVARQGAATQIVVVGMDVSAYTDTYVTLFDDATTASHTMFIPGGDDKTWDINMVGWVECSDGNTLKVKSNGGTGEIFIRWVAR